MCPQIIRIVITGGEHVSTDHDAPAHFLAEPRSTGLLIHFDDVAPAGPQAVTHAVIAREIGRGFGGCDDVISGERIFGHRQRNFDQFRTRVLEPIGAALPQRFDLSRHARHAIFLGNADAHAFDRTADGGFVIRDRKVRAGRILGVMTSHRVQ